MEFKIAIGPQFEGERIRKDDLFIEFGGPKVKAKAELATIKKMDEVEHGKIEIIGPDIKDLAEGGSYPLGLIVEVAGTELDPDMEPVFERRIHQYCNYIEGFVHMAQRNDIWLRISKDAVKQGLTSLDEIGKVLIYLYTSELPIIERVAVTFITDAQKVENFLPSALDVYKARDERVRGLTEEAVDEFYGCTLCQSFAPTHVCIVTPERVSLCGAISWFDGRAASKIDPYGPQFVVEKGELLDTEKIVYSGVNEVVAERSMGTSDTFCLHSLFDHPHTSCGCFESIAFYIPEVDGIGILTRDFEGASVIGIPFSTMAGELSGGKQVEGYVGMGVEYLRSPKFLQGDGGLRRVVWMPKKVKERVKDSIPPEIFDKIATEEDVNDVDALAEFLARVEHPVMAGEFS
ncbi:CO dehydrogenase/CO-methylating acetyl-CoA synthase complex subunit beta [Candidatus Acetothermia bacterium]|nr:CO dehydrogenase/CO-methylating acetyl-CoA synthase complex subunit beta [Candidatus Acetothermia bacterium]